MLLDLCLDLEKYVDKVGLVQFCFVRFSFRFESYLSRLKSQVQNRVAIDKETLEEKIAQIRGGIVAVYPDGLPEDDLVKIALDGVSLEVNFKSLLFGYLQIFLYAHCKPIFPFRIQMLPKK